MSALPLPADDLNGGSCKLCGNRLFKEYVLVFFDSVAINTTNDSGLPCKEASERIIGYECSQCGCRYVRHKESGSWRAG